MDWIKPITWLNKLWNLPRRFKEWWLGKFFS